MKRPWVVLGLLSLGLISTSVTMNYIATHSGPFAYFKDESGNKTAYERGHAQIAEWIKNGNDGARAIEQGRKAGFECLSLKSHHYPGAEPNTKSGSCRYVMGLIWGVWYFGVQTDNNGMIIDSFQDIAPPIGL